MNGSPAKKWDPDNIKVCSHKNHNHKFTRLPNNQSHPFKSFKPTIEGYHLHPYSLLLVEMIMPNSFTPHVLDVAGPFKNDVDISGMIPLDPSFEPSDDGTQHFWIFSSNNDPMQYSNTTTPFNSLRCHLCKGESRSSTRRCVRNAPKHTSFKCLISNLSSIACMFDRQSSLSCLGKELLAHLQQMRDKDAKDKIGLDHYRNRATP